MKKIKEGIENVMKRICLSFGLWALTIMSISVFLAANRLLLMGIDFWQKNVKLAAFIYLVAGLCAHLVMAAILLWVVFRLYLKVMSLKKGVLVTSLSINHPIRDKLSRKWLSWDYWWIATNYGIETPKRSAEAIQTLGLANRGNETVATICEKEEEITTFTEKGNWVELTVLEQSEQANAVTHSTTMSALSMKIRISQKNEPHLIIDE